MHMINKEALVLNLYTIGAIRFGNFTLKSHIQSPIYIDLRLIISYPALLKEVSHGLASFFPTLSFDMICGVPYTALPIATALSLNHEIPMLLCRKEPKSHGTKKLIEGTFHQGQICLILEDVITSGSSILQTAKALREEGLQVKDAIVVLNREQGGVEKLEEEGISVHSFLLLFDLLQILKAAGKITEDICREVRLFLQQHSHPC